MSKLSGEVVYIRAFDLAYDMARQRVGRILGRDVQDCSVGLSRPGSKQGFFYRPQMFTLPAQTHQSSLGPMVVSVAIKVFNVGAVSVQLRVPFEVSDIGDLVDYYGVCVEGKTIEAKIVQLAEQVRQELGPYLIRPVATLGQGEYYTVFCLYDLPGADEGRRRRTEDWLMENRRAVTGLLTQERNAARLSEQEAAESTERYLTYYDTDLVVTDWDAALVVGEQEGLKDVIHVMELANVQLVELAAYDRVLDGALEAAYRDLSRSRHVSRQVRRNLREIRIDMARLNDELLNITKFFGDWHLARVYQNLSGRFHLGDWHGVINVKLRTLAELYQLLYQDRVNLWMVVLETTIVLLFVLDVLLLLVDI